MLVRPALGWKTLCQTLLEEPRNEETSAPPLFSSSSSLTDVHLHANFQQMKELLVANALPWKRDKFIVDLPPLLEVIISEYLDVQSTMNLDSAVTNHLLRPYLLATISQELPWLTLGGTRCKVNNTELLWLTRRSCTVKKITLCADIKASILSNFFKRCHGLIWVTLDNCRNVTDAEMFQMARAGNRIERFILWGETRVTNRGLYHLSCGCRNITGAIFNGNLLHDYDVLESLASNCPRLETIIFRCRRELACNAAEILAEGCIRLHQITISIGETMCHTCKEELMASMEVIRRAHPKTGVNFFFPQYYEIDENEYEEEEEEDDDDDNIDESTIGDDDEGINFL